MWTKEEEEIIESILDLRYKKKHGGFDFRKKTRLRELKKSHPKLYSKASKQIRKDYDKNRRAVKKVARSAAEPAQRGLRTATAKRPAVPVQQPQSGSSSSAVGPTQKRLRTATADRPAAPVQQPQIGDSSSAAGPTQKRLRTAESSDPRIGLYDPKNPYRPTDENGIFTLFPVVDKKEIIKSIMRSPYAR